MEGRPVEKKKGNQARRRGGNGQVLETEWEQIAFHAYVQL